MFHLPSWVSIALRIKAKLLATAPKVMYDLAILLQAMSQTTPCSFVILHHLLPIL
jgi:hypothetical protein